MSQEKQKEIEKEFDDQFFASTEGRNDIRRESILFKLSQNNKEWEECLEEEKEQLDKNDPDNYGACYAIGGFNDYREKVIAKAKEKGLI